MILFENMLLFKMNVYFVYCCSTVVLHVLGRTRGGRTDFCVETGVVWKTQDWPFTKTYCSLNVGPYDCGRSVIAQRHNNQM